MINFTIQKYEYQKLRGVKNIVLLPKFSIKLY